jgi:two-component system capsular synthesis response regulator RcsB
MFEKIIVAEDIDSISLGLKSILEGLEAGEVTYCKYCEEALLKIRTADSGGSPYQALITDLSFSRSHVDQKITSGEELIVALQKLQLPIKIIVYSIEEKGYRIRRLMDELGVDAYVSKGRNSAAELANALHAVYKGSTYISPHLAHLQKPGEVTDFDALDIDIIRLLAQGRSQPEIEAVFQKEKRRGASLSSIEKRIIRMKVSLEASNTTHLVAIAKDMGLL